MIVAEQLWKKLANTEWLAANATNAKEAATLRRKKAADAADLVARKTV